MDARLSGLPETACWRVEPARRIAFLIDNESYYAALLEAFRTARRSIHILGWTFDPRTRLAPDGEEGPADPDEVGRVLIDLARRRPELDVRLLIWKSTLSLNGSGIFLPHRAERLFAGTGVRFRLDGTTPFGACHHQKAVVIDDQLAFCGGGDFATNRWDTHDHLDGDGRRILPHRAAHPPRHEVTMTVEGAPARALGDLFRQRWRSAVGEDLPGPGETIHTAWPSGLGADLRDCRVGVSRTFPATSSAATVDEIKRLTLACIAQARDRIYLESQYFTSALVTNALARRLNEPAGPEIVLIVTGHAPNWFDRLTMDRTRDPMIRRLREADRFDRFRAFWPATANGEPIVVHSKIGIFDERMARVGSANLNNRSAGFDSECELAAISHDRRTRDAIGAFRDRLLAHFLGSPAEAFAAACRRHGLVGAIDLMNQASRLVPIQPGPPSLLGRTISRWHIGDPREAGDSWRLIDREA